MSRGGRGAARGGKRGPDLSWDDEETSTEQLPDMRRPQPLFPQRYIPTPKPLTTSEKSSVSRFLSFRDRMRRGPLYTVLDPAITVSSSAYKKSMSTNPLYGRTQPQSGTSKHNSRAGFNPFTDQEKYTKKYHRVRRTIPDLSAREYYTLKLFPLELWSTLDPKRKMPDWDTLTDDQKARVSGNSASGSGTGKKRKRGQGLKFDDDDNNDVDRARKRNARADGSEDSDDQDDDDDVVLTGRRKKKGKEKEKGAKGKQKKGLDAEDDYPEVDQQDDDVDGQEAGEDEPQDSEFGTDEEEDEGLDDYNAEQYFDDGADDFADGDGGDDEGGGVF